MNKSAYAISWVLDCIIYCMFLGLAFNLFTNHNMVSGYIALMGSFIIVRRKEPTNV